MKHYLKTLVVLIIALVFVAGISYATPLIPGYSNPTVSAPNDNGELEPITIGSDDPQGAHINGPNIKTGGLTVFNFLARGNAWMQQHSFFTRQVRGIADNGAISITAPHTTLRFGANNISGFPNSTVSLAVSGDTAVRDRFQSDTLITGPDRYVCSESDGVLVLCGGDVCTNLPGYQPSVPFGYNMSGGLCVEDDLIPVVSTSCDYQMIVTKVDNYHADFNLYHNGVSYNYVAGGSGPSNMYVTYDSGIIGSYTQIVPGGHLQNQDVSNAYAPAGGSTLPVGTEIPVQHVTVLDVTPATINGGEVCWVGY